jgi:hypothetical protein
MDLQGTKFELSECCYINHKQINKSVHKLSTNTNLHMQTQIRMPLHRPICSTGNVEHSKCSLQKQLRWCINHKYILMFVITRNTLFYYFLGD